MGLKWGEGIFIISDINNSGNGVEIRHLKINHSVQHKAFHGAAVPSQSQRCLKLGRAPRDLKSSRALLPGFLGEVLVPLRERPVSRFPLAQKILLLSLPLPQGRQPASFFMEETEMTRFTLPHFLPPEPTNLPTFKPYSLSGFWI